MTCGSRSSVSEERGLGRVFWSIRKLVLLQMGPKAPSTYIMVYFKTEVNCNGLHPVFKRLVVDFRITVFIMAYIQLTHLSSSCFLPRLLFPYEKQQGNPYPRKTRCMRTRVSSRSKARSHLPQIYNRSTRVSAHQKTLHLGLPCLAKKFVISMEEALGLFQAELTNPCKRTCKTQFCTVDCSSV